MLARNDLHLIGLAPRLPVKTRGLERRLGRLTAAGGEEDRLHVVVGNLEEAVRQGDGRDVGRADIAGEVGELLHLGRRGVRQLGAPMTRIHVPEPGEPIDVFAALDILND